MGIISTVFKETICNDDLKIFKRKPTTATSTSTIKAQNKTNNNKSRINSKQPYCIISSEIFILPLSEAFSEPCKTSKWSVLQK